MQAAQAQQQLVLEDDGVDGDILIRGVVQEGTPHREALMLPAGVLASVKGKPLPTPSHPLGSVVRQYADVESLRSFGPPSTEVTRLALSFWDPRSNVWPSTSLAAREEASGDERKAIQRVERRLVAAAELAEREVHVQLQAVCLEHERM